MIDRASPVAALRGARVLVVGLGASGEAAARHLAGLGAVVAVVDRADDAALRERAGRLGGVRVSLGREDAPGDGYDLVVVSPGVPDGAPLVREMRSAGVPVWSEVELAYRMARAPILGVTGTNGKTTTTQMLASALTAAGVRCAAAGNIGTPLTDAVAGDHEAIVAELSSFQLRTIETFRARVAVLLNLAEDHLDWHGSFDAYAEAKARIFENQTADDAAVFHVAVGARAAGPARRIPFAEDEVPPGGAGVDDGWIVVPEGRVVAVDRLRATGRPNRANAVAAAAAACAFGADPAPVGDALAAFGPQAHRMEDVAVVGGVAYVNDSKATNPHAALAGLAGLERVVLIAGGRNKGLDLRALGGAAGRVLAVVALGEAGADIEAAFAPHGVPVETAASMEEAVERAAARARPGDTVLLSPACASFDMFADYRARGEAFRAAVKRLESGGGGIG